MLGRPMTTPPAARPEGAPRGATPASCERSTGRAVDPGDGDPRHERRHARARDLLPLAARAGDEVVVPSPCFFFDGPIRSAGAVPGLRAGTTPTTAGAGTPTAIEHAIGPRTAALLLCNPGNPTGGVSPPGRRSPPSWRSRPSGTGSSSSPTRPTRPPLWDGAALSSAFGARRGRDRDPQSRQEPLAAASSALESLPDPPPASRPAPGRSSGTASASVSRRRRRRSPRSRGRATGSTPCTPTSSRTAPSRSPRSRRRPGSRPPSRPRRRSSSSTPTRASAVAAGLAAAGLPVVDGVHFQAPGYARLPFAGAARAADALAAALGRWAAAAAS